MNHSLHVSHLWLRIDYLGIVFLTLGDFVSGIYLVFFCQPRLQKVYWSMVNLSGLQFLWNELWCGPDTLARPSYLCSRRPSSVTGSRVACFSRLRFRLYRALRLRATCTRNRHSWLGLDVEAVWHAILCARRRSSRPWCTFLWHALPWITQTWQIWHMGPLTRNIPCLGRACHCGTSYRYIGILRFQLWTQPKLQGMKWWWWNVTWILVKTISDKL